MLLAIDLGNTNVVFALFEGRRIRARWRIATDPRRTGDEYAVWLSKGLSAARLTRSSCLPWSPARSTTSRFWPTSISASPR